MHHPQTRQIPANPLKRPDVRAAFSMLEITLVIVILALALLPILSTFSSSHQNTRVTLEEIMASNFASELLEALQALPYDQLKPINSDLTMGTSGDFTPDPFDLAKTKNNFPGLSFKKMPQNFQMNLVIEPFPAGATKPLLKSILLTVKWGTRNQQIKLMTLKGSI